MAVPLIGPLLQGSRFALGPIAKWLGIGGGAFAIGAGTSDAVAGLSELLIFGFLSLGLLVFISN